ncbi:uncharacterized protein [Porites lutea]|uniref:uncharacterized protein n=1 Tax=Porites lutea TaxID=51062 RepID=UPI003CC67E1D
MLTMAHKLYYRFRQRWTYTAEPKQKVFQAAKSGNAVRLDKVLHMLDFTERVFVLDKQYILDGCSLPGKETSSSLVSPLVVAVQNGNLDCVKVLLSYGADIEGGDDMFRHLPLFVASFNGNVEILSYLLDNGVDMNAVSNIEGHTITPLIAAVQSGNLESVKVLLKYGADIEGRGDFKYVSKRHPFHSVSFEGCTPLFVAAVNGNVEILNCLLDSGADLNAVANTEGHTITPLIFAVQNGDLDRVKLLLQYGADTEGRGDFRVDAPGYSFVSLRICCTPLLVAAVNGNVKILSSLLENGADINAVSEGLYTPLMMAVRYKHTDAVEFLMDEGADANLQDKNGYTALHYVAIYWGSFDATHLRCFNNRSDFNIQGADNRSPLMRAVNCHNLNVVNYLLQNGAYLDLEDRCGQRCLQFLVDVSLKTSCEILSSLIRSGADINARINEMNQTLLMRASFHGGGDMRSEKLKLLIENGANLDLQDKSGNTALHYAVNSYDRFVILVNAGASQLCNSQGLTPLLAASKNGDLSIVAYFLCNHRPEITKEKKIDALELVGASVCLKLQSPSGFKHGLMYIKRGMRERFADPSHPLLKQQMEPVEAYQNRKECQTLEELDKIEGDENAIIMESLVIRERILGINNKGCLLEPIRNVSLDYFRRNNFSTYLSLQLHAIKIAQSCHEEASYDFPHIIFNVLQVWSTFAKEDLLIERMDQVILAWSCELEMQRKMSPKKREVSEWFLKWEHDALMELVWMIGRLNCGDYRKLLNAELFMKALCNLNSLDCDGNTYLHLVQCSTNRQYSHVVTKLLLNAGFNVNAINNKGNTPLHLAVSNIHLLTDTLEVLFDGGAHHDFVNNDGKIPMDMATTVEAHMILSERRKLELKCICARAVKKFGIPYMGLVPKTLEKYISMH